MKFHIHPTRRYTMRNKLTKIALAAGFLLALAFTFSCSSDNGDDNPSSNSDGGGKKETYYMEEGGVSVKALELIEQTPGISAADAIRILNQYPVIGDKYKVVKSRVSRAELEKELDERSTSIPGVSKESFLNRLNTSGRSLDLVSNDYNDVVYFYVQKE
jgi:hypothetical protein